MIISNPSIIQSLSLKHYLFIPHFIFFYKLLDITHNPILALVIHRLLNYIFNAIMPHDKNNFSKEISNKFNSNDTIHVIPLYVHAITVLMFQFWVYNNYYIIFPTLIQKIIAAVFVISIIIAPTINTSHQLFHRDNKMHIFVGYINLVPLLFTTYPIQHIIVHHKAVGSLDDPVTSPKNQNLYQYFVKVIFSSYKINFNYSKLIFILCIGLHLGWILILYKFYGYQRMIFGIVLAISTLFWMEGIQYIQHYGLIVRTKDEKVSVISSWNTYFSYGNFIVHKFHRHSDHHMNKYKIYPTMDLTPEMPTFNIDFSTAVMTAIIPSDWYQFANPLVDQLLENKKLKQEQKDSAIAKLHRKELITGCVLLVLSIIIKIH